MDFRPWLRSAHERIVSAVTITASPVAHVGRMIRRAGGVALDVVDVGRRTYEYARPLGSAEPPIPAGDRARLIAAAGADELLLTFMRQALIPDEEDPFAASAEELPALVDHLEAAGVFADPASFHEPPRVPELEWTSRAVIGRPYEHVTFRSPYAPAASVPGATRYARQTDNAIAHAWVVPQEMPAPWVVCVHGAGMGDPLVDLVLFRAHALHRQGFNVALTVLPHHGPRGVGRFRGAFPGVDLVTNLHGASQAIADVRAVLAYVATRGEPTALYGLSLGGYVAAAVAALEPSLCAAIVGIPVVDLSGLMRSHTPRQHARDPRFLEMFEHAAALEAVTSPIRLGRPAAPVRRIYAGRADRLVRAEQIVPLVEHWGLDDATWYTGGHLGFMTSPTTRRCLDDALVDAGLACRRDGDVVASLSGGRP
jgi:pimeloyl-ACP methyl ester carboxylesterase